MAAPKPTPAGASVAALSGALAAALVRKAALLTIERERHGELVLQDVLAASETLYHRLLHMVEEDIAAFDGYLAALRLPKDTADQKAARSVAVQKALIWATVSPINIAESCAEVLKLCRVLASQGAAQAAGSSGVAAISAGTGLRAAVLSAQFNLGSIRDETFAAEARKRLDAAVSWQ